MPEARRAGTVVVVLVPVFALKTVHQRQPAHVLCRRLVGAGVGPHVADAVDEALRVQRPDQPHRSDPEERGPAERQPAEDRQRQDRDLQFRPHLVAGAIDLLAVLLDRRPARLPEPAQVRPPEAADARAGDVLGRVGLRVVKPVVGGPGQRRARAVEHREERQHVAHHRMQLDRLVRDRAVVARRWCRARRGNAGRTRRQTRASRAAASRSGQPRSARGSAPCRRTPDHRPASRATTAPATGAAERARCVEPRPSLLTRAPASGGAACRPASRSSARSASTSGLPVVSSFSPKKTELAPARKQSICASRVSASRPADSRTRARGIRMRAVAIMRTSSSGSMRGRSDSAVRTPSGIGRQRVDRHALRLRIQVRQRHQHPAAIVQRLAHADDAARADRDSRPCARWRWCAGGRRRCAW